MDDRQQRIHEQSQVIWMKIVKMTREYQAKHFFWPDYIVLEAADIAIVMSIWGYIPRKIAGVNIIKDFTHMGSASSILPTFVVNKEGDVQYVC